ncbi:MAG: redoxin domain-containing protein [Pirellula sp.]
MLIRSWIAGMNGIKKSTALLELQNLYKLPTVLIVVLASPICWCHQCEAIESNNDGRSDVYLPGWSVASVDGKTHQWRIESKAQVFCFLGCECPVARFYATRLASLYRDYNRQGIDFVGVMSNRHDSKEDVVRFATELSIPFPLILDSDQEIARSLHASRTAEIVVLDPQSSIVYRGRVDDQMSPGVKRAAAKSEELRDLLSGITSGKTLSLPNTTPVGCLITFDRTPESVSDVSYCKDVAPIFYKHCYECHRAGDIGPFDIADFDEVKGWAEMIGEVVTIRRMPPWHASAGHVPLRNQRSMQPAELETIQRWVAAGSPYGNKSDLPELPSLRQGWLLSREPDLVVAMRNKPYNIPADGTVDYQYFVVDPKLTEDKWVNAAQVIPGNAGVVHHAIVFIRPPDGEKFQGISWLTAFVPGQRPSVFPAGLARRVPAGSKFVFQMHYTPNGIEQSDLTKIGMTFVNPGTLTHEVSTIIGIDQSFEIAPNEANHVVSREVRLPSRDSILLAVSPHMHLRGKSFQLRSKGQDLEKRILLNVPQYDFNWQHTYEFESPLPTSQLDALEFEVVFDNSAKNPFNPNPNEYVMWGDQTWEEMAVAFFEIATPLASKESEPNTRKGRSRESLAKNESLETGSAALEWAKEYMGRFDKNGDGRVSSSETNDLIRRYSFSTIDKNGDGFLTSDELVKSFEGRRGR